MKAKSETSDHAEQDAELLRRHRHDEVGMAVGQDALHGALARPLAEPAAARKLSIAVSTWKVSPPSGLRKRSMRPVTWGMNMIGGEDAGDAGAAEPEDPEPVQAGHEERAPQTIDISIVWPKSGCSNKQASDEPEQQEGEDVARHVAGACAFGEQPGGEDDEGRLRNSDGWMPSEIQRREPFTSTPKRSVATTSSIETTKTTSADAPDALGRQEGDSDHHRQGRHDEERLPVDEVEHVRDADALGDRGARRQQTGPRRSSSGRGGPRATAGRRSTTIR